MLHRAGSWPQSREDKPKSEENPKPKKTNEGVGGSVRPVRGTEEELERTRDWRTCNKGLVVRWPSQPCT